MNVNHQRCTLMHTLSDIQFFVFSTKVAFSLKCNISLFMAGMRGYPGFVKHECKPGCELCNLQWNCPLPNCNICKSNHNFGYNSTNNGNGFNWSDNYYGNSDYKYDGNNYFDNSNDKSSQSAFTPNASSNNYANNSYRSYSNFNDNSSINSNRTSYTGFTRNIPNNNDNYSAQNESINDVIDDNSSIPTYNTYNNNNPNNQDNGYNNNVSNISNNIQNDNSNENSNDKHKHNNSFDNITPKNNNNNNNNSCNNNTTPKNNNNDNNSDSDNDTTSLSSHKNNNNKNIPMASDDIKDDKKFNENIINPNDDNDNDTSIDDSSSSVGNDMDTPMNNAHKSYNNDNKHNSDTSSSESDSSVYNGETETQTVARIKCQICQKFGARMCNVECQHNACFRCIEKHVLKGHETNKWSQVLVDCPIDGCNNLLMQIYLQYLDIEFNIMKDIVATQEFLRNNEQRITCVKCKEIFIPEIGNIDDIKPNDNNQMTNETKEHYIKNRFRCVKCRTVFCGSCNTIDYHIGFTCQQYKEYKAKRRCRFCDDILNKDALSVVHYNTYGIELGDGIQKQVCKKRKCTKKSQLSCDKILNCGHNCIGIRGNKCLPCVHTECTGEDKMICCLCRESLFVAPTILLECGHYFHLNCIKSQLKYKHDKQTLYISFGHLQCPQCRKDIKWENMDKKYLKFFKKRAKIAKKAVARLRADGITEENIPELNDKNSPYYLNIQKYALDTILFYTCNVCKEMYYGGRKECNANFNNRGSQEDQICGGCQNNGNVCRKHDPKNILYKCRFCCAVSSFYCWGSCHFCIKCHERQMNGEFLDKIDPSKLPKCQGIGKCPSGGNHIPNGTGEWSFCLTCLNNQK